MKISARKYGKQTSGGAIRVNIRLRPLTPRTISREDAQAAFDHIVDTGTVPDGYELAVIDWKHPGKATARWHRGRVADLESFGAILAMAQQGRRGASGLRIAVVKPTDTPDLD